MNKTNKVAPHVGAWIETLRVLLLLCLCLSHPMWVRGLKPYVSRDNLRSFESHPMWVRGLKLQIHLVT